MVGENLEVDEHIFVLKKGNPLVDIINQGIEYMKNNKKLDEINRKFFTSDFKITYDDIGDGVYTNNEYFTS